MKLRPRHALWLALLLLLPGLFRLRFDVDVLNLLPANVPAVQGLKLHQKYFADANELIVTIEAEEAEEPPRRKPRSGSPALPPRSPGPAPAEERAGHALPPRGRRGCVRPGSRQS